MSNSKVNNSELQQALQDRTSATEEQANAFLRAMVEVVVSALDQAEQVKINGLGTFKLQQMAPRKSVNVNTGEAITIPGYQKVVFTPEISLKEMVEKNGTVAPITGINEAFTTEQESDETLSPIEKLRRQAEEIVEILAEIGQGPLAAKNEGESTEVEQTVENTTAEVAEEPKEETVAIVSEESKENEIKEEIAENLSEETQVESEVQQGEEIAHADETPAMNETSAEENTANVEAAGNEIPLSQENEIEETQEPTSEQENKGEVEVEEKESVATEGKKEEVIVASEEKASQEKELENPSSATEENKAIETKKENEKTEATKPFTPSPIPTNTKNMENQEKKSHFLRDLIICVSVLIVVLVGAFFLLRDSLSQYIEGLRQEPLKTEVVVDQENTAQEAVVAKEAEEVVAEVAPVEEVAEVVESHEQSEEIESPVYENYIAIEEIRNGSRLMWLAYRYYGNKALWVYIYDANKGHLDNPNDIEVGTPLRIPELTEAQKDTTLESTRRLLKYLEAQAMEHAK